MKAKTLLALCTAALGSGQAWELDLWRQIQREANIFVAPGEEVDIILGGTAGTGGQWMYFLTNPYIFHFNDQVYEYLPTEPGETGGPFKLTLQMQADEVPDGILPLGQLRMAYARPWEFDQLLLHDKQSDAWREQAWIDYVLYIQVAPIIDLDPTTFENGWHQLDVHLHDLLRITLPKSPVRDGFWSINAWPEEEAPVQLMHERFEFWSEEEGGYGKRILIVRVNQIGKFEINNLASWGDGSKIFLNVTE